MRFWKRKPCLLFYMSYKKTSITDDPEFPTDNTKLDHNTVAPQYAFHFELKRFENWFFFLQWKNLVFLLLPPHLFLPLHAEPTSAPLFSGVCQKAFQEMLEITNRSRIQQLRESGFSKKVDSSASSLSCLCNATEWGFLLKSLKSLARITLPRLLFVAPE